MEQNQAPRARRWPRAVWAALLSMLMVGLGQVYAGDCALGISLFVGYWAALAGILLVFALLPITPGVVIGYVSALGVIFALDLAVIAVRRVWRAQPSLKRS